MPDPESTIESTMRKACDICKSPDKFSYRLKEAENDIIDLHDKFSATKKEIFAEMKKNKEATDAKFDQQRTWLIANLTAVVISLLLLLMNLFTKKFGGT